MAKKDKKKSAEKKERNAAKQLKKADKKEKKNKTRGRGGDVDSDAEDVDLDAVLAAYAEEQAKFLKVTEIPSAPPTPRSSSTIVASPANRNELLVFGGEYFDGTLATFFNNLYVYLIDRREWREVTSPNSPLPRSGHAWCRGGNAGGVYLFGGEFSSPKQGTFYHYNDFWHLDPATREWSRLEPKGKGPPARSGHRMTYFKVCNFSLTIKDMSQYSHGYRTISSCLVASKTPLNKQNTSKTSGSMTAPNSYGSTQFSHPHPANQMRDLHSHSYLMSPAPFCMAATHVSKHQPAPAAAGNKAKVVVEVEVRNESP